MAEDTYGKWRQAPVSEAEAMDLDPAENATVKSSEPCLEMDGGMGDLTMDDASADPVRTKMEVPQSNVGDCSLRVLYSNSHKVKSHNIFKSFTLEILCAEGMLHLQAVVDSASYKWPLGNGWLKELHVHTVLHNADTGELEVSMFHFEKSELIDLSDGSGC